MPIVLFVVIVALPLAVWVVLPAARGRRRESPEDPTAERLRRRRHVLDDLRDLEMDREMGKIEEADYLAVRAALEEDASRSLRDDTTPRDPEGDDRAGPGGASGTQAGRG